MKYLLLQARKYGDPAAGHERSAFARELGVDLQHVVSCDLLSGAPARIDLLEADCVLVGGSGDFGAGDATRYDWLRAFVDTMGWLTTTDVPMFASCFGFQALVVACGGRIETHWSRAEFGTYEVTVAEAGERDLLFRDLAPRFYAQFGHADCATVLPSEFVNLASTERNEFQAATIPGKRIYMTQFHPELSMEANRERALMYRDSYAVVGSVDSFDEILDSFRETPESSGLLPAFARDYLGQGAGSRG